jgi:hypothetical protein
LPKPIKWAKEIHAVRERVANSKTETWSRQDIMWAFDLRPAAAKELMTRIGNTHMIGSTRFVGKGDVLSFLDAMIKADKDDNLREALASRSVEVGMPPQNRRTRFPLPRDAESTTLQQLPEAITLSPGRIIIDGESFEDLLINLYLLGQALQNDSVNMRRALEPGAPPRPGAEAELDHWLRSHRME